ncbi:hypothetical protein [Myxococcus xanthus]|nr:hypothetical protein [Myxococcus xanthus]
MVKVADAKATTLATLQALVLAFVGGELAATAARCVHKIQSIETLPGAGWLVTFLWAAGIFILALAISICLAVAVLYPRLSFTENKYPPPSGAPGVMWIDRLLRYAWLSEKLPQRLQPPLGSPNEYVNLLGTLSLEAQAADYAFENLKIARLVSGKFYWLKLALLAFLVALGLALITIFTWVRALVVLGPPT